MDETTMDDYYVSVIVSVYNRASQIHRCLDALLDQTYPKEKLEILVVDDYSTDDLGEAVKKYPDVKYVLNELKFGLPAARNMGMKEAKGDILIFLDDDAIVEKNYIQRIVEVFKNNENIGGTTGRIERVIVQDIKKGILGKIMVHYVKIFGISGFFANQKGIGEVLDTGFITSNFDRHESLTRVKWLSGCNMCYRRKAMEDAGSFDNDYGGHAYFEDADFSHRVYQGGYELYAVPDAVVDHRVTPVSREKLSRIKYFQLINNNRFFLKNLYGGNKLRYLRHIIAHWSLFLPVFVYSLFEKNWGMLQNYLKAEKVILRRVIEGDYSKL